MKKADHIAFADMMVMGDWRVEYVTPEGNKHITIFSGDDCERRAVEYAAFKNGKLPIKQSEAPASAPTVAMVPPTTLDPQEQLELTTVKGEKLVIRPKDLFWQYNAHLRRVIGSTRRPIEVVGQVAKGKK